MRLLNPKYISWLYSASFGLGGVAAVNVALSWNAPEYRFDAVLAVIEATLCLAVYCTAMHQDWKWRLYLAMREKQE